MSGDQYFSVLSKAVNAADFIASPEAVMELYQNAHSGDKSYMRPYINKYLHGVRDWTMYYAPLINGKLRSKGFCAVYIFFSFNFTYVCFCVYASEDIMFFGVPYCFHITLVSGVAVLKYAMFSTDEWLPREPRHSSASGGVMDLLLKGINLRGYFGVKGGEEEFLAKELNLPKDLTLTGSSSRQKAVKQEVNMLKSFFPSLIQLALRF